MIMQKKKEKKNSCLTQGGVLIKMDQQYVLTLEMLQGVVFFSAAKECLIIVASPVLTTEHLCSHVHFFKMHIQLTVLGNTIYLKSFKQQHSPLLKKHYLAEFLKILICY